MDELEGGGILGGWGQSCASCSKDGREPYSVWGIPAFGLPAIEILPCTLSPYFKGELKPVPANQLKAPFSAIPLSLEWRTHSY